MDEKLVAFNKFTKERIVYREGFYFREAAGNITCGRFSDNKDVIIFCNNNDFYITKEYRRLWKNIQITTTGWDLIKKYLYNFFKLIKVNLISFFKWYKNKTK